MTIALYPGTFDPITKGHISVARRAAKLFDEVIIAIAIPNYKESLFTPEEKVMFCKDAFKDIPNIRIETYDELTVAFAKRMGCSVVVRGLRAVSDYEYELQLNAMNKYLDQEIDTVFLMSSAKYSFLSSSITKQVCSSGGDISGLVTPMVNEAMIKRLNK